MTGTLVIVGASLAGLRAAEAARKAGHDGHVVLVGEEKHLPYDRPPLSKGYLSEDQPDEPHYREEDHLRDELGIELVLGEPATKLDTEGHTVTVGDREISYDALVIATGAHAKNLPFIDPATPGVFTVRNLDDSRALRDALRQGSPRVTVIGAGFIGSEVASVARKLGLEATILEALEVPLAHAIGEEMGAALTELHHRWGTTVHTGASVEGIETGENGEVTAVTLADGTSVPTDVLVVGVGAAPATGWLDGSGLEVRDGVVCDQTLRAAPGVYAIGDVARWPNTLFDEEMRLEHWTTAAEQAATAVKNALDPDSAQAYTTTPYFWSDWYESRIQFVGVSGGDEIQVVAGSVDDGAFTALYRRGGVIGGALALDMRAEVMKYKRLIGKQATWDEALELAKERREQKAAKEKEAAEKAASDETATEKQEPAG